MLKQTSSYQKRLTIMSTPASISTQPSPGDLYAFDDVNERAKKQYADYPTSQDQPDGPSVGLGEPLKLSVDTTIQDILDQTTDYDVNLSLTLDSTDFYKFFDEGETPNKIGQLAAPYKKPFDTNNPSFIASSEYKVEHQRANGLRVMLFLMGKQLGMDNTAELLAGLEDNRTLLVNHLTDRDRARTRYSPINNHKVLNNIPVLSTNHGITIGELRTVASKIKTEQQRMTPDQPAILKP